MPTSDVEEFFDGKRASEGEGVASDSSTAPEQEPAKTDSGVKPEPVAAKSDVAEPEEDKEEPLPSDKEGLLKAIAAIRGDRRRDRKKWREVEKELQDERKQREDERRERARLEGELSALRQRPSATPQAKQAKEPEPDPEQLFWEKGPGAYLTEREQSLLQQVKADLAERERREFERDRSRMRRQHDDFEPAEKAFLDAAKADPSLFAKAEQSGDALYFVYQQGKELQRLREYGEVASVADLEAKIRAKVEAEMRGQSTEAPSQPSAKPPIPSKSIASARGSGAGVNREWSGPRSADSFFTGPRI